MTRFTVMVFMALLIGLAGVALVAKVETQKQITVLEAERSLTQTRHGVIEYVVWGNGPTVLSVHGAGGGFDQGRLLAETFGEEGFQYISISRFGYLGSSLPDNPSTEAQAEAIVDLLNTLEIDQVSVIAMSGGVPPTLKLAELYPERLKRMVLLSSAPFTPFSPHVENRPMPTWMYSALLGNDVVYWILIKVAHRQLERAFDVRDDLRDDMTADELTFTENLINTFLPASKRLRGVMNEGAAVDPKARYDLERVPIKSLVVHAKDDRLNPFTIGKALGERLSDAQFIPLETGGHLLLGRHAQVREEIHAFLNE